MIGIYGGTFDPIHFGHLRTALDVKEALDLDELRFLPCKLPPHRPSPSASAESRLRMLELALRDAPPGFRIDDRELRREGLSYMVDTLSSLREESGVRRLCLILGFDAFVRLPSWHRWKALFQLAHVVVMTRPENQGLAISGELADAIRWADGVDALKTETCGLVLLQPVTQLAISATVIRNKIQSGADPLYLLPGSVAQFIKTHGLYQSATD